MRAREIVVESDNRNRLQKLLDVINHPATEETIRSVAKSKLQQLIDSDPSLLRKSRPAEVNIEESDFDRQFVMGVTIGQIYDSLCGLTPRPSRIEFFRQGTIRMFVPPPFHGLTKSEYYQLINDAVPGLRSINSTYHPDGYLFFLSFI